MTLPKTLLAHHSFRSQLALENKMRQMKRTAGRRFWFYFVIWDSIYARHYVDRKHDRYCA
jgi:hypothetical protein